MSAWTMAPGRGWSREVGRRRGWRSVSAGSGVVHVVVPGPARGFDGLRVTARGKFVLVVAAVALTSLGWVLGTSNVTAHPAAGASASAGQGFVPVSVPIAAEATVVVRPGDTLWSIAARTFPGADPREAVVAFRAANQSQLSSLQVGQRLVVPARL